MKRQVLKLRRVTAVTWKILSKDTCKAMVNNIFIPRFCPLWFTSDSLVQKNLMFALILGGMIMKWKPHLCINSKYLSRGQASPQFLHLWALTAAYLMRLRSCPDTITPMQILFYSWRTYWTTPQKLGGQRFSEIRQKGRVRKTHLSSSMSWLR